MNPQGYEHDHVIPTNIEDVAKVLQAAAHSASCTAGLLMVASATGWEQLVSSGQSLPKADEAWLRMISSYGDVVLVGQDSPANTMETNSSGSTLIYVAIRGFRHELLGAMLLRNSDQAMVLSAAQRYALQAQAAHIRTYLQPGRDPEANNPLVTSFERLRLLESVVINANDAILITEAEPIDLPGPRIVYCNPAFLAITGFTEEEVIGRTPRILQCEETSRATLDVIREALSHWRAVEVELLNTRKDGSKFWVELSIVPVANEKGWFTHWVSVQRDITERKESQQLAQRARLEWEEKLALQSRLEERERISEELTYIAFHDELTSLFNRAYLMNELTTAFEIRDPRYERATVLFLDLDGFKVVNDSMGHLAGDKLLKAVANRLQTCVRSNDVLARIGGDEFAILLMGKDQPETAVKMAERIVSQLHTAIQIENQDIFISCSIGIVTAGDSHTKPEELLRDADVAMYSAKKQGRGRWSIFNTSMREAAIDTLVIQNALRQALEDKDFLVFYQPIYSGTCEHLVGVEALVRWNHATMGIISPDAFIPIAEDLGIIHELGAWVMHQACSEVQAWRKEFSHLDLRLNVNVSGKELSHPGFVDQVTRIIATTGLPAGQLQIEVTESVFLYQPDAIAEVLRQIRQLGVRVALDDFGTGYSSLGYIDRYPIDAVKIDRSFVSRMMTYERSKAIVSSILSLGRALNLDITAEGVETAEQYNLLRKMGCPYFQGYLLNRPMRSEALLHIIKSAAECTA
ncbi:MULTISPECIES: putative bifunctional diguanylate cyclase/phosphodiesterase [Pseudomonas syringae group]|uniref:cyclic-guanylate-specific phosphodiesterase n=2 Tax=Pseudomonas syringae group TaxID=136849 RepID=A0A2V4Q381_PSESJ|nr:MULTISPECIES: EAL domain-containing protein [Pseudomonas syringae group]PYD17143.1 diguanylate phosphodiesterase [Pseudomonas syringae pv. pisi]PYD31871.1 diguanylate phosphodiesterase [Pseudomonas syringae pv. pisi]PYD34753.1 diguanylate phosphodiesterase [Pseudomonas syringae pv. pisi]RML49060.1 PAS:GGDEF protein [Pseudomonas syringae pv. pisi]RML61028.1 PAS:GGDEF protein [Pseudomonas syringae pv. pisi]